MSQAHYVLCDRVGEHLGATIQPAVAVVRSPRGQDFWLCLTCLNKVLDWCDDRPETEPVMITWVWGPDERCCVLHGWSAVLCEGWTAEHRALRARGLFAASSSPTGGA